MCVCVCIYMYIASANILTLGKRLYILYYSLDDFASFPPFSPSQSFGRELAKRQL